MLSTPVIVAIVALVLSYLVYLIWPCIVWCYRTWFVIAKEINKLPGDPVRWPYGNLHQSPGFNEKQYPHLLNQVKKFNRAWRTWFGPFLPFVTVSHPDTVRLIAKTEEPKFTDRTSGYILALPWLGEGLLLSKGPKWKRNRRLLTPAFHFDILKSYVAIYNKAVEILMSKWTDASKNGESIEIQSDICLCTLSIILRCAFSYEENIQLDGERHPYANAVLQLSRLILERTFNPLILVSDTLYKMTKNGKLFAKYCNYVHQVAEEVIAKRKEVLRDNPEALENKKYLDFLDILLKAKDEEGRGLTDAEIRDEVDTFLFEGHDTTASGISWALYSLAKHPEYQKKAQEEIDNLLKGRENESIMWEDLGKLPYLTQCLKEALRLWSPVPIIGRQLTAPLTIDGVTLPEHTLLEINIMALHHNPTVWGEEHDEYKPERFHPDNITKMDNFAFLPFSAGPRNCIGQNFAINEEKVVIARILHRFSLSLDNTHQVKPRPELVTRSMNGIKIKLQPR